ncbi:hypothetical protein MRX96_034988 [Rhipicephalus microplus]
MKRNKSRRHSNSSKGEPQEVDNVQKEGSVRSKATIPGGAAAGTDHDPGVLSRGESAQSDQPVIILSAKRTSSGSHRRRHRSKSGSSSDAAEKTTEPKVNTKSKAAQQVPVKGEAAEAEQPAPNELAGITSGIGQYLQSLLPSHNSTAQEESAQKPLLPQNPPTTLPPLQQPATAWPQQAVPLMTMPRQALPPQAVLETSVLQQQSQSMPPVTSYLPPPQFPQPNFPIAQALPYAYGGMVPPWYGLPQQIPVGQTPLHFLPPLSVNPATVATPAPIMHPQAPPPIAASSAALTTKPEAAGTSQANQPQFVTMSHYAHVEPSAVIAPVSATRDTMARVAEPVPDVSLHVADDFGKLSPPILSELPSVVQSPTSQSSHRRQSRRQFVLDGNAIDNTVVSPQDAVAREDYNQSVSRVFKKQRSQHKNLHDEGHEFEEGGETQTFPVRHRDYRPSRGRRKGSEEPVDEVTDQIVSPISTPISPPRSKGKSRSRSSKLRRAPVVAPELVVPPSTRKESIPEANLPRKGSASSNTQAAPSASGVDKEVLKKLVDALAARRQALAQPILPGCGHAMEHKCHHRSEHVKHRHHDEKEREQDNSENFFEEIVEEIVPPEKGTEGRPKKRLVRKTTKMRTHNVTEDPLGKKGQLDEVPLVDRVEAMRSMFSKGETAPSHTTRWSRRGSIGHYDTEAIETASWGSGMNQSSPHLRPTTYDDIEPSDSAEYEPSPFRVGQRCFKPPFPRPLVAPWYQASLSPRYAPWTAKMAKPNRLIRPIPCFDCATIGSRFPGAQIRRDHCPSHTLPLHTHATTETWWGQQPCCDPRACGYAQAPGPTCPDCQTTTLANNQCNSAVSPPPAFAELTKQARRPRRVVYRSCPPPPGLPVIDDTYRSTAVGGVGAKGVPCRCCPYGARNDDVDQRQVSLEEVLRYEDTIRQDAQLEDRRRLLDEERIREDERLAFREYLAENDLVLNDDGGHLPDTQLKEFKEALQRKLAKRRASRAKFEAAHSRPGARELPKVDTPSSGQARIVTEGTVKERNLPGALKPDVCKEGGGASRRKSHPSTQLGAPRKASFAAVLETEAGPTRCATTEAD